MQESAQVLEWQKEARKEGRKEGREDGMRNAIKRVLKSRIDDAIPEDILSLIGAGKGVRSLNRLLEAAATADTWDDFRNSLK